MKTVLIIEDQADIRELIRMTLELEGLTIEEAEDGDKGFALAKKLKPSLILLDVMMPGSLDGYAVCRLVKSSQELKRTRVLMLSAKAQTHDKTLGLDAGADAYISKPFSPKQLLDIAMRLLA
jgi:DNA-binding response OmpR family regulator